MVLVTHDLAEAAFFADRVVLLRAGQVVQEGSPADLWRHPVDAFVTRFVQAQRGPEVPVSEAPPSAGSRPSCAARDPVGRRFAEMGPSGRGRFPSRGPRRHARALAGSTQGDIDANPEYTGTITRRS